MPKTLFFSVGEPSGDQHAARLIRQLSQQISVSGSAAPKDQQLICRGFGGPAMQRSGCQLDLDLTQHAVVGLLEVLPKLREFFRFADQAEQTFATGTIDGVVLVDFPGFNWHIAKRAKKYGIPVYYYCPPQLWAWGAWRVGKMRRTVDHVLTVLPMETDFFEQHGIQVHHVGHPFFDAVANQELDAQALSQMLPREDHRLVAVLPGSRDHEVARNFPLMLETIRRLDAAGHIDPTTRFAVAAYRDRHCLWCQRELTESDRQLPIDFYVDRTSEVIETAHCAMMVSGSVSLELLARGTPAAVVYRVGRVLHTVGKRVLKVDSVTLPNLMAKRKLFPEFVSVGDEEPAIDFLTETTRAMLTDVFYHNRLKKDLEKLRQQYGMPGAAERAANFLRNTLELADSHSDLNESNTENGQTNHSRAA